MHESELTLSRQRGLSSLRPSRVVERIKEWREIERLQPQLEEAVWHMSEGRAALLPGQGVYVLLMDGKNKKAIEALRSEKGRRQEQREATVVPPSRLFQMVDFDLLNQINPRITRRTIQRIYDAHPTGLILPCLEEKTPPDLITYHEVGGERIATIMNIWLARYRLYKILWKILSQFPDVLSSGSSANRTGFPSPTRFDEAFQYRAKFLSSSIAIKDPFEARHFYQGSHTVINLILNPPVVSRGGSVHPEKHPREFQKFRDILPNLVVP